MELLGCSRTFYVCSIRSINIILQVFAIEFVTFPIDFVPVAVELVAFAVEFVPFAIEFIGFAMEFIIFRIKIHHVCTTICHNYIDCNKPAAYHEVDDFCYRQYHLRH